MKDDKEIIEIEKVEEPKHDLEPKPPHEKEGAKKQPEVEVIKEEPAKDKKGFSIAALVLGIISLVLFCLWYISIPCGILAIIFGILGIKSTKKGMSIAGVVTGAIGLVVSIVIFFMLVIIGITFGIIDGFDTVDDGIRHYNRYEYNRDLFD